MAGIYPNPSGSAENYKVGDQVKWFTSEKSISPYVGVVTQVCPSINKVWVDFPLGGNQQKDPTELILVTPFTGTTPCNEDTGYSSYDKTISDETYGTLRDHEKKLATKVACSFATNIVDKIAVDIVQCIKENRTDIQTYQKIYPKYSTVCSDGFIKSAISKIFKAK
jgi:hypothetical protein